MDANALLIKRLETRNAWLEACLAAALAELKATTKPKQQGGKRNERLSWTHARTRSSAR